MTVQTLALNLIKRRAEVAVVAETGRVAAVKRSCGDVNVVVCVADDVATEDLVFDIVNVDTQGLARTRVNLFALCDVLWTLEKLLKQLCKREVGGGSRKRA
jgi:hypothetical protein